MSIWSPSLARRNERNKRDANLSSPFVYLWGCNRRICWTYPDQLGVFYEDLAVLTLEIRFLVNALHLQPASIWAPTIAFSDLLQSVVDNLAYRSPLEWECARHNCPAKSWSTFKLARRLVCIIRPEYRTWISFHQKVQISNFAHETHLSQKLQRCQRNWHDHHDAALCTPDR